MNYLFDLYGTLIDIKTDEEREELWQGGADILGEPSAEMVREEYLSLCRSASRGDFHEIDLLAVFEAMLEKRGLDTSFAPKFAEEFRRLSMVYIRPFYGVKKMLSELKGRGKIFLVSNAQSCFTMGELDKCGLLPYFDGIVISSDVGVKKPDKRIFEIAFERFGITPNNSVYVGNDLRDDVLGATKAGLPTIYINTAQSGRYNDPAIPSPTYTVANHKEMKRLLLSLGD